MTLKEALALANLLRRLHGIDAEHFCERMVLHFAQENRPAVSNAWRRVLCLLAPTGERLSEHRFAVNHGANSRHLNGASQKGSG